MNNTWRVMGMWDDGSQFLIVMGSSQKDCERRLWDALEDYTLDDLERMDSMWYENWKQLAWEDAPRWEPISLISLRRYKLRKGRSVAAQARKNASAPAAAGLTLRVPPHRPSLSPSPAVAAG